jgi:hypothetical protein
MTASRRPDLGQPAEQVIGGRRPARRLQEIVVDRMHREQAEPCPCRGRRTTTAHIANRCIGLGDLDLDARMRCSDHAATFASRRCRDIGRTP